MASERIAVVGLGLLGRGIAACFAARGFEVIGYEPTQTRLDDAQAPVEQMIAEARAYAALPDAGGLLLTTELAHLAGCSLVLESAGEDFDLKKSIFQTLEQIVAPETLLATNTSSIPITPLQQTLRHPERFLGLHFAAPAHLTRFLELIRGAQTSDRACAQAQRIALQIGKEPCLCKKDVPGFLVNRIAYAMYREAFYLLETGVADADTIDRAMRNALSLWAAICGPLRWIDLSGGPELYAHCMERVLPTLCNASEISPLLRALRDRGARGTTNGEGIFSYAPEDESHWAKLWHDHAVRTSRLLDTLFPLARTTEPESPSPGAIPHD